MSLAPEDSLRLNVLLKQELLALRIDEGKMLLHGLTARGEAKIQLNPNCAHERYLRKVRELLSMHALGSTRGYPVFLKRWTRMGQMRSDNLEGLLRLGEPEAVTAVVHAPGLTDELARRAWWAEHSAEHARAMLAREAIVQGEMGRVLAAFLIEFLPYEENPHHIAESVRLVLQADLIDETTCHSLWAKGQRKPAWRVGFLKARPDALPETAAAHPRAAELAATLDALADAGNVYARQLARVLAAPGQAFLATALRTLEKAADPAVAIHLFEAIWEYFEGVRGDAPRHRDVDVLLERAVALDPGSSDPARQAQLQALIEALPDERPLIESLLVLSHFGEPLLAPILGSTDAVGAGLRARLEPLSVPLTLHLRRLMGA
ncbi:MAG: DsrS [Chromatiales bacterium]|nr:DsrS [Chromatiales bacterium]